VVSEFQGCAGPRPGCEIPDFCNASGCLAILRNALTASGDPNAGANQHRRTKWGAQAVGVADSGLQIAATIASAVSAITAALGLVFVGIQIRAARRASDFQALLEFNRHIDDREQAFFLLCGKTLQMSSDEAYHSLLNLLEVYAAAHNRRLIHKTTADL
jgi:hypothetical protein